MTDQPLRILFFGSCLLIAFILPSCTRTEVPETLHVIPLRTSDILYAINISGENKVTAVGGYVWDRGIAVYTDTEGRSPQVDTIANKGQHDLLRDSKGQLITVGTDGYLFVKREEDQKWEFRRLTHWDILHQIIEVDEGYIASGGKSYEHGYIYLMNHDFKIDTAIYTGYEISSIARNTSGRLVAVGWGNIRYSEDGGRTWTPLSTEGDFFSSIVFTHQNKGFVTGYNGSLLYTTDGGLSWSKFKGDIQGNGYNSFRKIKNMGNGELLITGNNGKLWRSMNGGQDWKYYRLNTNADLYDAAKTDTGKYMLAGSNGFLAIVSL